MAIAFVEKKAKIPSESSWPSGRTTDMSSAEDVSGIFTKTHPKAKLYYYYYNTNAIQKGGEEQWLLIHPKATGIEMERSGNGRSSKILSMGFGISAILILGASWTASPMVISSKVYAEKNNSASGNMASHKPAGHVFIA